MEQNDIISINRSYWDENANAWFGTTALPEYGVYFVTEDELHLFGDVADKRLLEIGCGSGHSLAHHAAHGAAELWGIDLSKSQLENAREHLRKNGHAARLICSPMEADCGIPDGYFDIVYSIYALGWTTDLPATLRRIYGYLKPGGMLIFSWRHPVHGCVKIEDGTLIFRNSYFDERPETVDMGNGTAIFPNRKISSYVNALADTGFVIEKLIEETDAQTRAAAGEMPDRMRKAQMLPFSFLFRARKRN